MNQATITGNIKNKINNALPPSLQNTVNVSFVPGVGTGVGALKVLRLTSSTAHKKSIIVQPGSSNDITSLLM